MIAIYNIGEYSMMIINHGMVAVNFDSYKEVKESLTVELYMHNILVCTLIGEYRDRFLLEIKK